MTGATPMKLLLLMAMLAQVLGVEDMNKTTSGPTVALQESDHVRSQVLLSAPLHSITSSSETSSSDSQNSGPDNVFGVDSDETSDPQVLGFHSASSRTSVDSSDYIHSSPTSTLKSSSASSCAKPQATCKSDQDTKSSGTTKSAHDSSSLLDTIELLDQSDSVEIPARSSANTSEANRFMSFEEWKKQKKLELDASSAESEVTTASKSVQSSLNSEKTKLQESADINNNSIVINEDQGRTYKDKFNYASVDCAATVVKTNSDAKGASSILTEVKDSYLINQCSTANKFIVVELCQDVLISSIVMGNFELFSSMFRMVRFSVSDRFPAVDGWHELGQFEAQNRRDVQSFQIENPLIWSRYLKIDILSHYGNEFYCPLSILRVHGTNMMEDFKNTESINKVETEITVPKEEFLNYTADFNDECKALSPYLAMNEFLKVFNSSSEFCGIEMNGSSATSAGSPTAKATQESIFQNIIKRLSLLESNATLSLLYVEEQSKLLSDAFASLEERQVKKFENLLSSFNENIHSQVQFLDASLQKINEESKSVLQTSRVFTSNAVKRIKTETAALVSELTFLKKLVVIDTLIILSLLVYVVFREAFIAEDLFKKENGATLKKPMRAFPVSKRKPRSNQKRWNS